MERFDLAVIGGGSAGLTAATIAGRVGANVLLIDKERLGGDCTYYGCVPSKALIHCAKVAHSARKAERFGIQASSGQSDIRKVLEYVWSIVDEVASHETPEAMEAFDVKTALGGARFLSSTRIAVGEDQEIEAERSIIAVGSHAKAPPIEGLKETGYINHVSVFHLEQLPKRLAVIGGGPIGVEIGQALARLGSEVTILQRGSHLLPKDDPELTSMLAEILSEELQVICNSSVQATRRDGNEKVVSYQTDGESRELRCDEILVAVGRAASLSELGLEDAGVTIAGGLIEVDENLRTSKKNIWAAGDCVGPFQFTHFAEAQARTAARNALFVGSKSFDGQILPWTTFCDPELAHVGLTEDEAKKKHGEDVKVYRYPYDRLDRALCEGAGKGLAKLVCSRKGKILGASILGPRSGEAISNIVLAMEEKTTVGQLSNAIFAYPTMNRIVRRLSDERFMEEGIGSLTRSLFGQFKG